MPWNNQGGSGGSGGPWGPPPSGGGGNNNGGGNSPWGRPSGSGGGGGGRPSGPQGSPPDLEDIFRKGQDRFKQAMPGGIGGGRGIAIILLLLAGVWALTGFYRVQPDENGVVMRFGEWVRTTPPGLHYHLPFPIETVEKPPVTRVNIVEIGYRSTGTAGNQGFRPTRTSRPANTTDVLEESLMLTGDENIIDIDFVVQWRIADPEDFLFNIRRPADTVQRAAESAMREVIGRTDLQPALTEARAEIEIETRQIIQQMLDEYGAGVEITAVQLQDVKAPEQVIDAFDDVQRARADRERLRNEAEAYRNDIIPRARGNAERVLQEAQAYREQVVARATGDAERFNQIFQAYQGAKDVTLRRLYLETMEEVLSNANKIIMETGATGGTGGTGVVPYLPLDQLTRGNNARRAQ